MHAANRAVQSPALAAALQALQQGEFVMVFDGDDREGETDLFIAAQHATPEAIGRLRNDAGGLVFVALGPDVHRALGLPFLHDLIREGAGKWPILDQLIPASLPYDARSSFSLTVNHRDSFTGITDTDRAMTVQAIGRIASLEPCIPAEELQSRFSERLRTPGHVAICSAADGLLSARQGHTELAVAMARLAGIPEAIVGAEILRGVRAMSPQEARAFAEANDIPFVTGKEIQQAWQTVQEGVDGIPVDV